MIVSYNIPDDIKTAFEEFLLKAKIEGVKINASAVISAAMYYVITGKIEIGLNDEERQRLKSIIPTLPPITEPKGCKILHIPESSTTNTKNTITNINNDVLSIEWPFNSERMAKGLLWDPPTPPVEWYALPLWTNEHRLFWHDPAPDYRLYIGDPAIHQVYGVLVRQDALYYEINANIRKSTWFSDLWNRALHQEKFGNADEPPTIAPPPKTRWAWAERGLRDYTERIDVMREENGRALPDPPLYSHWYPEPLIDIISPRERIYPGIPEVRAAHGILLARAVLRMLGKPLDGMDLNAIEQLASYFYTGNPKAFGYKLPCAQFYFPCYTPAHQFLSQRKIVDHLSREHYGELEETVKELIPRMIEIIGVQQ
jgi:hypothetical protein